MTNIFLGMLIGGIFGTATGSLGTAVYYLKKEACRLKNCRKEKEDA